MRTTLDIDDAVLQAAKEIAQATRTTAGEVLAAVNAMGHGIVDVSTREADLEDVFLNLTRAENG